MGARRALPFGDSNPPGWALATICENDQPPPRRRGLTPPIERAGERTLAETTEGADYRRVERSYGSFTRSFSLPETVDDEAIEANLADGVLTVRLPKKEAPTARKIAVSSN